MRHLLVSIDGQPPVGTPYATRAQALLPDTKDGLPVIGTLLNNDVVPLSIPIVYDATLVPLTAADPRGYPLLQRTLCFILSKVIHHSMPGTSYRMCHSISNGLYVTVDWPRHESDAAHAAQIAALKQAMADLISRDIPIAFELVSYEQALKFFDASGQIDKLQLLGHRNPPSIPLLKCDGFYDLAQQPLAHRTGLFPVFDLFPYRDGLVLLMPSIKAPAQLPKWAPTPKLFDVFDEHRKWGRILGATSVGQLNEIVAAGQIDDLIQTAEALHEKKLTEIAAAISDRTPPVRLLLIAGPSSAGKTTTAKRLCTHLRVNGLTPFLISTDDYFVGDELNPRDEHGHLDYEHIEAVDMHRLNAVTASLLAGRPTTLRGFDFKKRAGFDRSGTHLLPPDGIIVMEGIHCLNPRLTSELPDDIKFRLFVSALTQLGIDRNHRISTSDNRLIRRMVRDNQHRGRPALETLAMWPSVQRGERRWIFPFQDLADTMFNSALDYELGILKSLAAPLLNQIKPMHPQFAEARRLTGFLSNFAPFPDDPVPGHSILREYIGNSQLKY